MKNTDWKTLIEFKSEEDLRKKFEEDYFDDPENEKINWKSGGIFKTITYLLLNGIAQIYLLLLKVVPMGFLQFAKGEWLDLKVAEINIARFTLSRTTGKLICIRDNVESEQIIKKGTIVKTDSDLNFFIVSDVRFAIGQSETETEIIAENPGSIYNVAPGKINVMTVHLNGVRIYNPVNWIIHEGAEDEEDDSLRERYYLKIDEMNHGGNYLAYESWVRSIPGVTSVWVDQWHPRGQGTVDVWISCNGEVTGDLIKQVKEKIEEKKPPTANVEVYAAENIINTWEIVALTNRDPEEIKIEIRNIVEEFYNGSENFKSIQQGQTIYIAQVSTILMNRLDLVSVKINSPLTDLKVEMHQKNSLGLITVIVERVS